MTHTFNVGDIVRYAPEWCSEGERKLLHVIKERRLNPIKNTESRFLIYTLNSGLVFGLSSTVDDFMIEPTGFTVDDYIDGEAFAKDLW